MVYLLLDMTHNERQLLQALRYAPVDYCVEPQNIDVTLSWNFYTVPKQHGF